MEAFITAWRSAARRVATTVDEENLAPVPLRGSQLGSTAPSLNVEVAKPIKGSEPSGRPTLAGSTGAWS